MFVCSMKWYLTNYYKIMNTYYRQRYQVHRQLQQADPELQKVPDHNIAELL